MRRNDKGDGGISEKGEEKRGKWEEEKSRKKNERERLQ